MSSPPVTGRRNEGYGRLGFLDYFILFYCMVRILGNYILELLALCVAQSLPMTIHSMGAPHLHPDLSFRVPPYDLKFILYKSPTLSHPDVSNLQRYLSPLSSNSSRTNNLLNTACLRSLIQPGSTAAILSSHRYSAYRVNINHEITSPEFAGNWVVQHSIKSPQPPRTSDIVIFFLHGGGYQCSQPAHYLLYLLRLAESVLDQGVSVSIFALDYSLAPEHVFPTQLREVAAAYAYLVHEEHISAEKIIVAGDSAGGHLALSFLVDLDRKRSGEFDGKIDKKPGGLLLMSPWLSLHHEPPSFTRNAKTDVLSGPFLRKIAYRFLGHDSKSNGSSSGYSMTSPLTEFISPEPRTEWQNVLPPWVWASAGKDEIFFDDIDLWANIAKTSLGAANVEFEVGFGKVHDWQWLETIMDEPLKKRFLENELGDGKEFESITKIGNAIVRRTKESGSHT